MLCGLRPSSDERARRFHIFETARERTEGGEERRTSKIGKGGPSEFAPKKLLYLAWKSHVSCLPQFEIHRQILTESCHSSAQNVMK